MMNLIRITSPDDRNLDRLIPLYEDAFPAEERRDIGQLRRMIKEKSDMYFSVVECDGELCGFFVYWDMKDFYYLEHLAVYPSMRNKKIGQQVLNYVADHLKGIRLLEVEPMQDEMTTRRVRYYQRNGYQVLEEEYIQPSYDGVRDSCPLWIMGNQHSERLPEFIETIKRKVYTDNYGLIEK
ncbi:MULTISPECIES: GNAT family N-acetyltransferase [Porphyromonadaceae]|uniref:Acetyltransferase n=1 Tax=Sanguibacteroides justesenii TaxID=1547597 RepID=A0AB34R6R6_9PORP|nr:MULTISPECIES: GNAT family N-acetyltransferase [Porphyromonadaceae]KIO43379.1 acetyltransferase [Sanguibacteroides justesenii]PXZ45348.1 GNAT family N-acetyltransferase [Sanguibacteroides justesenii]